MSQKTEEILERIRQIARESAGLGGGAYMRGTVESVQEAQATCAVRLVLNEDIVLKGVSLRTIDEDGGTEGLVLYPAVGSAALVAATAEGGYWAVACSALRRIAVDGGENGGMVKVVELVGRLNTVESKLNEVINAVKSHTHFPVPPNGTAPPSAGLAGLTEVDITVRGDIENEKVRH